MKTMQQMANDLLVHGYDIEYSFDVYYHQIEIYDDGIMVEVYNGTNLFDLYVHAYNKFIPLEYQYAELLKLFEKRKVDSSL